MIKAIKTTLNRVRRMLGIVKKRVLVNRDLARILREADRGADILEGATWRKSLTEPTGAYGEFVRFFNRKISHSIVGHRRYFSEDGRGFGEDAFHAMWYALFTKFYPKNFLEIGVYRGQTISLISLLAKESGISCDVCGISPFQSSGDTVSTYRKDIDYLNDTLLNFSHFKLKEPTLLKAYSTDEEAIKFIGSIKWDMIYIDGNHDYEVVRQDWEVCSTALKKGGVVVLDDSALGTKYCPPAFATAGHPGPSKLVQEINRKEFQEILRVGHNRVFQKGNA